MIRLNEMESSTLGWISAFPEAPLKERREMADTLKGPARRLAEKLLKKARKAERVKK